MSTGVRTASVAAASALSHANIPLSAVENPFFFLNSIPQVVCHHVTELECSVIKLVIFTIKKIKRFGNV